MRAFQCEASSNFSEMNLVTVVDYGVGNILSIKRALEYCGAVVKLTSDPNVIRSANRIVLPGVGAFGDCVGELKARGIDGAIKDFVEAEKPLLGICVGMQILFTYGTEFGDHNGLGLISGVVSGIPQSKNDGTYRRIPHIGWASLDICNEGAAIFRGMTRNAYVYFVHSFHAAPTDPEIILASADYQGVKICAAVAKNNIFGCQFHPEKSGPVGLGILKNFVNL